MVKAATPIVVLFASYCTGMENPTATEVLLVHIICIGVAIASYGELKFSWVGFLFISSGIIAESIRLVLTNYLMKHLKLDPLSSLYYISPVCMIMIGCCCYHFEYDSLPMERIMSSSFIQILCINGLVAFSLNVAVVYVISNTSALTFSIAGVFKVSMGVLVYTFVNVLCIIICIIKTYYTLNRVLYIIIYILYNI